jgi:uncharacterized protein (TIGR03000 family)
MYSVVLMMALSGSGDAPAHHWGKGCYGGYYASCYGCNGGYGCWGGYGWSCYGAGYYGCWGSSYGWGCHGYSYGCHGGLFGKHHHGYSCYGSCYGWGCWGGAVYTGCYGSGYGWGCCGGGCYGGEVIVPATPPTMQAEPIKSEPKKEEKKPEEEKKIDKSGESTSSLMAPATLVVSLPADATLIVDGVMTKATSAERSFITPNLVRGKEYFYRLQATWEADGKTVVINKRVVVRPGQETRISLGTAEAANVASR